MAFSILDGSKAYTRTTTQGDVLTGTFWVTYIEWLPAAENDDLQVQDTAGYIVAEDKADSVSRKCFPVFGLVTNLTPNILDGGSVIVRLGSSPNLSHFR